MSDTVYCSNCGALNSAKSKFCSECGSNLGKDGSPTSKEESPDTCPRCKQNDKAESVITIFQTQSSLVGYGKNRDVRQTALAQTIMEAVGPKPKPDFIMKFLFKKGTEKELADYETVVARMQASYYCNRCSLFFFTESGEKHSGKNFKALLRGKSK